MFNIGCYTKTQQHKFMKPYLNVCDKWDAIRMLFPFLLLLLLLLLLFKGHQFKNCFRSHRFTRKEKRKIFITKYTSKCYKSKRMRTRNNITKLHYVSGISKYLLPFFLLTFPPPRQHTRHNQPITKKNKSTQRL